MFAFSNDLEFARYWQRVHHELEQNELETIISAYGLESNAKTEEELGILAGLSPHLEELYLKKNLPVRLLKFLGNIEDNIIKGIHEYLIQEHIKAKTAKEILWMLIDLNKPDQRRLIEEMEKAFKEVSQDGLRFLNQHYMRSACTLRYPIKEGLTRQVRQIIRDMKLGSFVKIKFDEFFEETSLDLEIEIRSMDDLGKLSSALQEKSFYEGIRKIFEVAKKLDHP